MLKIFKRKPILIGAIVLWDLLVITIIVTAVSTVENTNTLKTDVNSPKIETKNTESVVSVCDGVNVVANCELDGVKYTTYKYYPPTEELSHYEDRTTYTKEITGYCTLCNDGTYSPSCATGRGACSHHGGVRQWSAPIYSDVAHTEKVKIIDAAATAERYEIIQQEN